MDYGEKATYTGRILPTKLEKVIGQHLQTLTLSNF